MRQKFIIPDFAIAKFGIISGTFVALLFLFFLKTPEAAAPKVSPEVLVAERAVVLAQKSGLRVFYKDFPAALISGAIGEPAQIKEYPQLLRAIEVFDQELAKYPKGFIGKLDWKHVVFLKKFFYTEHPLSGLYDPEHEIVYLEFLRHRFNDLSIRHSIHHEIFHIIHIQAQMKFLTSDPDWVALNHADFSYGEADDLGKDDSRGFRLSPKVKGFATPYSLTSVQEDMAEIFACLMIPSQYRLLKKWEKDDPVLRNKMEYIKSLLEKFDPSYNAIFWDNLLAQP